MSDATPPRWTYYAENQPAVRAMAEADPEALGPCGCTDYHLADCPIRTGGTYSSAADVWAAMERRMARDDDDGEE